jgi:chorismate mutase/prephenate dehydratase
MSDPALTPLRSQIDAIDRELLTLLNRRAALAQQVGEVKKHSGMPAFRPERETQVIDGLKAINPGPLATDSVAPIWREIMSACRALETPHRIAYLGPAGTFSELAALGYFGSSIVRVPCTSIDEVFRAASGGAADYGVVPVENSTEGVVARSLDLFLNTPLAIVG